MCIRDRSEAERFEARIIELSDENHTKATSPPTAANPQGTIVGLPGVKELLAQINAGSKPDNHGWAVVTSATGDYARKALRSTRVSDLPPVFVSSDDVQNGKPHPQPYLMGSEMSKKDISKCIVVEDAPAGVLSGKRAGARVLACMTTHGAERLWKNGADYVVKDLSCVSAKWENGQVVLTINSELRPNLA